MSSLFYARVTFHLLLGCCWNNFDRPRIDHTCPSLQTNPWSLSHLRSKCSWEITKDAPRWSHFLSLRLRWPITALTWFRVYRRQIILAYDAFQVYPRNQVFLKLFHRLRCSWLPFCWLDNCFSPSERSSRLTWWMIDSTDPEATHLE